MALNLKYGQNIFFPPESVQWPAEQMEAWLADNAIRHEIVVAENQTEEQAITDDGVAEFSGREIAVHAKEGSKLTLALAHDGKRETALTFVHVIVEKNASVSIRASHKGSDSYHRVRFAVELAGEGARYQGATIARLGGDCRLDAETVVRHAATGSVSSLVNRVVLEGNAKAIVRDTSAVPAGTPNCDCRQDSRALLLSRTAEADMIPVLDITTDQVAAAHAASVSRPDKTKAFYLESRGIDQDAARELLVESFLSYGK